MFAAVREGLDARIVNAVNAYGPSPAGPASYNRLFLAVVRGEVPVIVDARVGWVLAEDVAHGHLLAYERGAAGRRYVLCGEVATFSTVLNRVAELRGSPHPRRVLSAERRVVAGCSAAHPFTHRSSLIAQHSYGRLGPVRVDDAQARAIGFQGRGLAEGLPRTVDWLRRVADAG